jgi:predicted GIY-YIG superfamily endonuclease
MIFLMSSDNSFNIYILKCTDNKYYIGKTKLDTSTRYNQHMNDKSCVFTSKYPPIEIIKTYKSDDPLEEDNATKKYMMMHGIDNVRGGSYTKIKLEDWQIKSLEHEFKSASDCCYKCGGKNHLAKNCIELDINEYLSKYITFDEVNSEISNLENILITLNKLEHVVEELSVINREDIDLIKQITIANCKLIDLKNKLTINRSHDVMYRSYDVNGGRICRNRNDEQIQINNEIQKIQTNYPQNQMSTIIHPINELFTKYFPELKYKFENQYDIRAYKILNMKKDKIIELNKIKSIYKSDDIVKKILLELYNKRLNI